MNVIHIPLSPAGIVQKSNQFTRHNLSHELGYHMTALCLIIALSALLGAGRDGGTDTYRPYVLRFSENEQIHCSTDFFLLIILKINTPCFSP